MDINKVSLDQGSQVELAIQVHRTFEIQSLSFWVEFGKSADPGPVGELDGAVFPN